MTDLIHKFQRGVGVALDSKDVEIIAKTPAMLAGFGIGLSKDFVKTNVALAMDAGITQPITTPQNGVPVQFLQSWLAGTIYTLTVLRTADNLAPLATAAKWSDEEVVRTISEHTGAPQLYSDNGGINVTDFNTTYERRTIVRTMLGVQHTMLEDERSSAANINAAAEKRAAAAEAFEIFRNDVFFNGYDAGANRTFGFLNDPNLTAYVTVATGASTSTTWLLKTAAERVTDLVTAAAKLRIQSGSRVDPKKASCILAIPPTIADLLSESDSSFSNGMTVSEWLSKNYPNWTVEVVPQLEDANGAADVFYLYAEKVDGSGTDGGDTMLQIVPSKMQAMNTVQTMQGSNEGYTAATAGCYVQRGYAVVRYSGV